MSPKTISGAQHAFLSGESQRWVEEGVIPDATRDAILGMYEIHSDRKRMQSIFFTTLVSLGVLLLGAAVLLLVCYNWEGMQGWLKLTIIGSAMTTVYAVAWWLSVRMKKPVLAEVACFLGSILYGVGIWQIAQIYHVVAYYPHGVLMWALGVLTLAVWLKTPILHALTVVLLAIWSFMEIVSFAHISYILFGVSTLNMPNCALGLPFIAGIGWLSARWNRKSEASATAIRTLYTLLLFWWLLWLPASFPHLLNVNTSYLLLLGCVTFLLPQVSIGNMDDTGNRHKLFQVLGTITMGIALIPMTYKYAWMGDRLNHPLVTSWFLSVVALVLLIWTAVYLVAKTRRGALNADFIWSHAFFIVLGLYAFVLHWVCTCVWDTTILEPYGIFLQNVIMFLFGLAFMYYGVRRHSGGCFVAGMLYFLLWTILRYVDLFGNFGGMLGASAMFAFCAIVMFGMSWFWFSGIERRQS